MGKKSCICICSFTFICICVTPCEDWVSDHVFVFLFVILLVFVFVPPGEDGAIFWVKEHVFERLPPRSVPAHLDHDKYEILYKYHHLPIYDIFDGCTSHVIYE